MINEIIEVKHECGHLHEIMIDYDNQKVFFMGSEQSYQICPTCGSGISAHEMSSDYYNGEIFI